MGPHCRRCAVAPDEARPADDTGRSRRADGVSHTAPTASCGGGQALGSAKTILAGRAVMDIGAAIFFTEYSIAPGELAAALEARGFESLWVAEHSHIPVTRRFALPGSMELTKQYYDVMDPFVTLTAAAVATRRLKLPPPISLVIQRDTRQTPQLAP